MNDDIKEYVIKNITEYIENFIYSKEYYYDMMMYMKKDIRKNKINKMKKYLSIKINQLSDWCGLWVLGVILGRIRLIRYKSI